MTKKEACHKLASMNEQEFDLQKRIDEWYFDPYWTPEEKERSRRLKETYIKEREELRTRIDAFMRDYAEILYS